jgi:hypothetical protein
MELENMRPSNIKTYHSYFVRVVVKRLLDFSSLLDLLVQMLD